MESMRALTRQFAAIFSVCLALVSGTVVLAATKAPTVKVTTSAASITTAQPLTVTIAVSGGTGSATPGGTITLTSGNYISTASTLAAGKVSITVPADSLAVGSSITLTAAYTPTGTSTTVYSPATGTKSVAVTLATPTVTVTPSPASITTVQADTVTVAVSGGTGAPAATGSVTLKSGTYSSASTPLVSGSASIVIPAGSLAVATDTLTATYSPDAPGQAIYKSATGTHSIAVTKAAPTVTVNPSASSITVLQTLSVAVHVSAGGSQPTGSVALTSGTYKPTAATVNSDGNASFSVPAGSLAVGSDTLTVTFTPDSNSSPTYNTATGTAPVTVAKVVPVVSLTPSATGITTTQAMTVQATVTSAPGSPAIAGSVALVSGTFKPAAVNLASGVATINIPAGSLAVGAADTLTVTYTPSGTSTSTYGTATGTTAVSVVKTAPTVTVAPALSNITTVQALSVPVTVAGPTGSPAPAGTVTLKGGSYTSATATLASGKATISVPAGNLPVGGDTLTVTYTPASTSSSVYSSNTGTAPVTVALAVPTVTATPSSSSITEAQSLTVTVVVGGGTGNPAPAGTVSLSGGGYSTPSPATLAAGKASIVVPAGSLAAGSDNLVVTYTPAASTAPVYSANTGNATVTVGLATPTVTVTPTPASITTVQGLTVAVTVSGGAGSPWATGTVTLTSGSYSSGPITLGGSIASIPISAGSLAPGNDTLTATYTPDRPGSGLYTSATGTHAETVTLLTPTVTVTPGAASTTTAIAIAVPVSVSGGPGNPIPTGSVTLTSGTYTGGPTPLNADGNAFFTIPPGALAVGTADVLKATFVPDTAGALIYAGASGTHNVAVTQAAPTITSLSPNFATVGGAGFAMSVYGNSFTSAAVVNFGSAKLATTFVSQTQLTAAVTSAQLLNVGPITVTVTTAAGTSNPTPFMVNQAFSIVGGGTLPSAFVNNQYNQSINVAGLGTQGYNWTINGGTLTNDGTQVALSGGYGLTVASNGGSYLAISGIPSQAGTVTFTAVATDIATSTQSQPVGFTINIYNQGFSASGRVNLSGCNNGNSISPIFTVTINTQPPQTTTTDGNGNFWFNNTIPPGTYTITPSIAGPTSVFSPAVATNILFNSDHSSVNNINFQATLGYTVTGTVAYTGSGSSSGRIYVQLAGNNCGGPTPGTSLATPGPFTIRGVPPGSYTLQGWMDTIGFGAKNASDPAGSVGVQVTVPQLPVVTVSKPSGSSAHANVVPISQTLNLTTPSTVTLSSAPQMQTPSPFSGGVVIPFGAIESNSNNGNGVEMATSYTVQWSTTSAFTSVAGSKTFKATGGNGASIWIVSGLTNGQALYFRAQGLVGTTAGPWSAPTAKVTVNAPSTGAAVSGTVTIPSTVTISGPLYAGFYSQSTNMVYATVVASPSSSQAYSVQVPPGTYFNFAILDQNKDGMVDIGDLSNTNGNNNNAVTVGSTALTGKNITLSGAASSTIVATQNFEQINQYGSGSNYNLQFDEGPGVKLPVAVTLLSATNPNVITPMDIGQCSNCGGSDPYNFQVSLGSTPPKVGDAYTFQVTYGDGSTASPNPTATVTGVLSTPPSSLLPEGACTGDCNLQPTFTWSDAGLATSDTYSFQLTDSNYNTIWQIPGKNSSSNGFSNSITSITYGTDPTGSGSTPSAPSLSSGTEYYWQIQAADANGNSATAQAFYFPGFQPLALSGGSLPDAGDGTNYSATIAATGGYPCYNYNVDQSSSTLGNYGLYVSNQTCSTLTIAGYPTGTGQATFNVTVTDNENNAVPVGPVTFTINVVAALPVSLPTSTPSSLGPALIGFGYSGAVTASGGSQPYNFTVNGTQIPTSSTATAFASGMGLTATGSGSNTLMIGGTPTAGPITLQVSVTDGNNNTDTETYTITAANGPNGANNGNLKGQYTCLTQGFNDNDNARWASVATFKADGANINSLGTITGGEFDENGSDQSSPSSGTSLTGTYSIGADNNGLLSITASPTGGNPSTTQWAIALTDLVSPAQQFRMVEADNSSLGQHGTASCFLATPSAFAASTISGNSFSFQMGGENSNNNSSGSVVPRGAVGVVGVSSTTPKSAVGRFTASSGTISSGIIDMGKMGCTTAEEDIFTGTYTAPDANGRLLLILTPTQQTPATCNTTPSVSSVPAFGAAARPYSSGGSQSVTLAVYIVDASRMFIMETTAGDGLFAGQVRTQKNAPYSNSSINGPFVLYMQGADQNNGVMSPVSQVFQGTGSGTGNLTINASYADKNGTYSSGDSNGGPIPVTINANGKATLQPGNGEVYMELFNTNSAMMLSVEGNGGFSAGWVEPQVQPASSAAFGFGYIKGTYMMGASDSNQNGVAGEFTLDSSGNVSGTQSEGGEGGLTFDQPMSATAAWDSTTYGTFLVANPNDSSGKGISCIVINSQKFACTLQSDSKPALIQAVQ
jgi:hypothetical protein